MKTVDEVMALKIDRVKFFREMHRQMEQSLNMYNGDFHVLSSAVLGQQKFHEVLPVTARLIVESVSAHVRPNKMAVHFAPLGDTEKARGQADKIEELAHAMMERWGVTKSLSPFAEAIKNVCIYGLSGLRTLYDKAAWGEPPTQGWGEDKEAFDYRKALWEAQRSTTFPLVINAVDPLNMLPPYGVEKPRDMIEFYKVKPYSLVADFPDYKPANEFLPVDLTTYFDKKTWMYIVGNQQVGTQSLRNPRNPYGIVPYTMVWSGLGKNSPYGKPEQRAVGLIYPLMGLLKEEARSLTAVSIIMQAAALGRGYTRNAPEGGLKIGLAPGDFTEIGATEIDWFKEPPVSRDLYNLMQIAGQQIERMVGEKILAGVRPTGVTSALFEEILLEQAKRRYRTFIESMESAYADVIAQSLFLYENVVKQKIPGVRIKPEEVAGYYQPEVMFQYEDIAEKRIRAMIARMLFISGLIDFETAHDKDFLNTPNVSEVRKGLIKDKLYQDPELIAALAMQMAEEMGVREMLEKARARQQGKIERGGAPQLTSGEESKFAELLGPEEESVKMEGYGGGGFGYGEGFGGEVRE